MPCTGTFESSQVSDTSAGRSLTSARKWHWRQGPARHSDDETSSSYLGPRISQLSQPPALCSQVITLPPCAQAAHLGRTQTLQPLRATRRRTRNQVGPSVTVRPRKTPNSRMDKLTSPDFPQRHHRPRIRQRPRDTRPLAPPESGSRPCAP